MTLAHAVLALAVSVVFLGTLLALAVGAAAKRIERAVAETVTGLFETGARPEVDYPRFDEVLAQLHLAQSEDIAFGGELTLEYEPQPVTF